MSQSTTSLADGGVAGGVTECNEWEPARHALLHTASFLNAVAFVIPRGSWRFRFNVLATRALMTLAYAVLLLGAVLENASVCRADLFMWNLALVVVNGTHLAYSTWRAVPRPLRAELAPLYRKVFAPLGVSREIFAQLTRPAQLQQLPPGQSFFGAGQPVCDLSILLTGKLKVTYGPSMLLLHHINPLEFIDSTEWYTRNAFPDNPSAAIPQVSITAVESCTYLYWAYGTLSPLMASSLTVNLLMESLIGRDISEKLYSVAEQQASMARHNKSSTTLRSPLGLWQDQLQRSQSADRVFTTPMGLVRSHHWRRQQVQCLWQRHYQKLVPSSNESKDRIQSQSHTLTVVSKAQCRSHGSSTKKLTPSQYEGDGHEMEELHTPTSFTGSGFRSCKSKNKSKTESATRKPFLCPRERAQHNWNSKVKFTTHL